VGKGTGLGLSISLGIISEHGGRIWAENVPSGGCRFCIDLPLATAPDGEPVAEAPAAERPQPGLRILVADDEAPLRAALTRLFSRAGHRVTAVGSGREAIAVAAHGTFDVILLDMRMPDISGKQVFEQWRVERPELAQKVVFLTGDIVSTDLQQFLNATGRPFLPKPFDFDAVLGVLPR
jgi:CheY-like chemotaxis protein